MIIRLVTCSPILVQQLIKSLLSGYRSVAQLHELWCYIQATWNIQKEFKVEVCLNRSLELILQEHQIYSRLAELLAGLVQQDLGLITSTTAKELKSFCSTNKIPLGGYAQSITEDLAKKVICFPLKWNLASRIYSNFQR